MKTQAWRDFLYWVCWTTFMVVTTVSILDMRQSAKISALGIATIAPANLKGSIDLLRTGLVVEKPGFPLEQLVSSRSFKEHEARLAAYTTRLEMLEQQNREREAWLSKLSLASAVCMLITTFLRTKSRPAPNPSTEPPPGALP